MPAKPTPAVSPLARYQAAQAKLLVGRTIKDVQFIDEGFPVLILDDDTCVIIQQDDEGNGPGSMMFQRADGKAINVLAAAVFAQAEKK